MLGLYRLELDGNFFTGNDVNTQVDVACNEQGLGVVYIVMLEPRTHQRSPIQSFCQAYICRQLVNPVCVKPRLPSIVKDYGSGGKGSICDRRKEVEKYEMN